MIAQKYRHHPHSISNHLLGHHISHNTFKGLIGVSPTGACIFVSTLYTGGISDEEITKCSGILELIEPGDSVMADKGFDISYELFIRGCKLT